MKAAHVYAKHFGWRVLPVRPGQKIPLLPAWQEKASSDLEVITEWQREFPTANVGIATGQGSGIIVLDVDPRHGGRDSLEALQAEHGPLPVTTTALTPSSGEHYIFRAPPHPVSNSAGKLGPGLDIRGDGGQIVAAPSSTPAGRYRWQHAPWDVPPADAPDWLLAAIHTRAPSATTAAPTDRGYFPPASPEVLAQAAAALERHGPAIDGDGGGLHTVHAAAILTHDFALTDEEAWPLFEQWNETCRPPWDLDDLRERLRRGRKYGKAEYGCKRSLDAVEAARRIISNWQGSNPVELVDLVRPLAAICGDMTRRAVIERELMGATGLKSRELGLPKPKAAVVADPAPGQIQVGPDVDRVADQSLRAVAPKLFARQGVLCEVVAAETTFLHDVGVSRLVDLMSKTAEFVRTDENKGLVRVAPPRDVASILHERRTLPGVRVIEAVTQAPIFLADGSILQDRGYNAQARVYLEPNVDVVVPEAPTRQDAIEARKRLEDIVCDVPFASPADRASWLAGLLSPLVKSATRNAPAPMLCVSASSPGAGKTMLAELISRIITGGPAEVRPYNTRDSNEWSKRITSYVRAASPVSTFDNVNGPVGDEGLDRLLTSRTWSDRVLGASDAPPIPIVTTWIATGNNIEPQGDTVRRVMMCRIVVDTERPQERSGFKHPNLVGHVDEHRAEYLADALTILRAFHVAGRPAQRVSAWGSFDDWSALVREALVWVGCEDPFLTQQRLADSADEPEAEAHQFWLECLEQHPDGATAGDLADTANKRDAQTVLGAREGITGFSLRRFINRFVDKPLAGMRIRKGRDAVRRQATYYVELISPARQQSTG